jgi:hypothetical protein
MMGNVLLNKATNCILMIFSQIISILEEVRYSVMVVFSSYSSNVELVLQEILKTQ